MKKFKVLKKVIQLAYSPDKIILTRFFTTILLIVLTSLLNLATPIILKKIIYTLTVNHRVISHQIIFILCAYGISWTLGQLTNKIRELFMFRVFERAVRVLAVKLFEHINNLSFKYHAEKKTGSITNIVDRVQSGLPNLFWGLSFIIIPTLIEIIIAIGILWHVCGFFYGLVLSVIFLVYVIFSIIGGSWCDKARRISNKKSKQASAYLVDKLMNFETIKYFNNLKAEIKSCNRILKEREDYMTKQLVYFNLVGVGQILIMGIGFIVLTLMAGKGVVAGKLNVSDFVLINGYLLLFMTPLSNFGLVFQQIKNGLTDMEDVVSLFEVKSEINDNFDAAILRFPYSVSFKNVKFSYGDKDLVLNNISFEIPYKKRVAIVGGSGAGKTTIIKLLLRLYDVNSGNIYIGDKDISSVTQESLRQMIGIVPQDTKLLNDTLYNNLTYGSVNISSEKLEDAVRKSHLTEFVARLPNGYNTIIGEGALKISGGEKQRISIARVLLKQPSIFIFDEATSALDSQTEKIIQQNLEEISTDKTTLIITHRLSAVMTADEIIVLDKGKISERGNHEQLLLNKGLYHSYFYADRLCRV